MSLDSCQCISQVYDEAATLTYYPQREYFASTPGHDLEVLTRNIQDQNARAPLEIRLETENVSSSGQIEHIRAVLITGSGLVALHEPREQTFDGKCDGRATAVFVRNYAEIEHALRAIVACV